MKRLEPIDIVARRMNILVLSNMYPPHYYGGYELSCQDVVDRWRENGHQVTVLTTKMRVAGVDDPPMEREAGIRRDLDFYWDDHVLVSPSLPRRLALERSNQQRLREAIQAAAPDVVSVWNMGAMSLGLITTLVETLVPLVLVVCDDWLDYGPTVDAWTRLFVRRPRLGRLVRQLAGVPTNLPPDLGDKGTFCFVSDATRRWAEEHSRWHFPQATVVYSGIDSAHFPSPPTEQSPGRQWQWRLLLVSRIDRRKGLDTAIRALAHLPAEATLEILGRGDGQHLQELIALAAELGLTDRVHFASVDRSQVHRHYEAADVTVFTSTWAEPFGLVPIEAMACGTPVVASGTGGSAEFLADDVNCLLYPPGDSISLAAGITRLGDDAALRARLVNEGRATADELTVDRLAEVLETWHMGAANGFADGRPPDRPRPVLSRPRGESTEP
jgi:glycosyltransferase involved in cell wall biosynthesis